MSGYQAVSPHWGDSAFAYCGELVNVTIPDSVTSIEDGVFFRCVSLSNITIPDSVTSIGNVAFENCSGLTSITIPNSVTGIGSGAFARCSRLTDVAVPDSVTNMESDVFDGCINLKNIYYAGTQQQWEEMTGNSFEGEYWENVTIHYNSTGLPPDYTCGSNAFWTLENGVLTISGTGPMTDYDTNFGGIRSPWDGNNAIKVVEIQNGITSIGDAAFHSCHGLTRVNIPDSVTSIGGSAFVGCSNLTSVTIPYSVSTIGGGAFINCSNLTSITIPDSVTSIGHEAFGGCNNLTSAGSIGGGYSYEFGWTTQIPDFAFEGCSGLQSVNIPESVTSIGVHTFAYCESLQKVNIPNNVTNIGLGAFISCTSLQNINIPNGIKNIADEAFLACSNLTTVNIPESVTSIGIGAFESCKKLENLKIPTSVKTIGARAFGSCNSLTRLTIPDGVQKIEMYTFAKCAGLKSTSIPNTITNIRENAFVDCNELKDVYYAGTEAQWEKLSDHIQTEGNSALLNATIHYNSADPDDTTGEILVFSTEQTMTVKVGESMKLGFGYSVGGNPVDEWKKMAIVVSDPTIVSISDYTKDMYRYTIEVTGKKQGETNLTVTDTNSGKSIVIRVSVQDYYGKTYSYDINHMPEFPVEYEVLASLIGIGGPPIIRSIPTNVYNMNGLYVNNYRCIKQGEHYNVSFDAYNALNFAGAVDIYDKQGNWIKSKEIPRFQTMQTSLVDTGKDIFYLVKDFAVLKLGSYESESFSAHQPLSFEVPVGGYFEISNNFFKSPGAMMFNTLDIITNAIDLINNATLLDTQILSAITRCMEKELQEFDNELIRKAIMNIMTNAIPAMMTATPTIATSSSKNIVSEVSSFMNLFNCIINAMQITRDDILLAAENITEAQFMNWFELKAPSTEINPALIALKSVFLFGKAENFYLQCENLKISADFAYIKVYSDGEQGGINPYGMIISNKSNIDAEAQLQVFRVSNDDTLKVILDENGNQNTKEYELYNICFVKNDQLVQPNGKVTVHIPIPEGMKGDTCIVYRKTENNTWEIINAHVSGNYLVFETDHFSLYAIVGDPFALKISSMPNKTTYKKDDILDTTGLTLDLNGEQISEGYICKPMILSEVGIQKITVQYAYTSTEFNVTVQPETFSGDDSSSDSSSSSGNGSLSGGGHHSSGGGSSSSSGRTPVNVISIGKTTHGSVSINPTSAASGSTITITTKPDNGYVLDSILAMDDGKNVMLPLTKNGNDTYMFTMPDAKATVTAMFRQDEYKPITSEPTGSARLFADVPAKAYYHNAVAWAAKQGITTGTSTTMFSPDMLCTRAQIVTFLWRANGSPDNSGGNPFTDVDFSSYYYPAVEWVAAQGITNGTGLTNFSPDISCTRAQAVTFLYRTAGSPVESGENPFRDVADNAYYTDAVQWAVNKGITTGTSATTFDPNDNCTRAEIVTFLYRDRINNNQA